MKNNMNNNYNPALALIIAFILLVGNSLAQTGPAIQWQNTIGGSSTDVLNIIQQTFDGGYILGGSSTSNISGDKNENCLGNWDYWIIKIDSIGSIQWQNTIGGNDQDALFALQQTSDGGYILGGASESNISGDKTENSYGIWDFWILKIDFTGNILWQNTIGGNGDDYLYSIQQTTDDGYILGGISNSNISFDKTENCIGNLDYWIVKTDSLGNILWQNTIGGNSNEYLYTIQQTNDKGYILGGQSSSSISGDKTENSIGSSDYWIVKTDSTGNILWQNTIGGNNTENLLSLQQTIDGGYIFNGTSISNISGDKTENSMGGHDFWIVKADSAGSIQWQNTIGGSGTDALWTAQQISDGSYILGGTSSSGISGDKTETSIGGDDYWVIKIDSLGNIKWQNTIGGYIEDELKSIQQTSDGGYILGGYSKSDISGDKTENNIDTTCNPSCTSDYWIIKLGPDTITSTTNFQFPISTIQITPNPAKDNITLQLSKGISNIGSITITNTFGQIIYTSTVSNTAKHIIIPVSHYPPGLYIAKVTSGDKIYTSKFVVQ